MRRVERDVDFVRGSDLVATFGRSSLDDTERPEARRFRDDARRFQESPRTSPPRGCARKPEIAVSLRGPALAKKPYGPRERLGPRFRAASATTRAMLVTRTARRLSRPPLTFLPPRASLPARRSSSHVPLSSSIVLFVDARENIHPSLVDEPRSPT